jgi:hypothetical protein
MSIIQQVVDSIDKHKSESIIKWVEGPEKNIVYTTAHVYAIISNTGLMRIRRRHGKRSRGIIVNTEEWLAKQK